MHGRRTPAGAAAHRLRHLYLKRGLALAREMKWLGSYRYAVVNLGGADEQDLEDRYSNIQKLLGLEPT